MMSQVSKCQKKYIYTIRRWEDAIEKYELIKHTDKTVTYQDAGCIRRANHVSEYHHFYFSLDEVLAARREKLTNEIEIAEDTIRESLEALDRKPKIVEITER